MTDRTKLKSITVSDEATIQEFLRDKGLTAIRFEKNEIKKSKTPDFKVFDASGNLVFYCEVKTVAEDDWLDKQIKNAPPLPIVGGARPDPAYNKISNKIHEAVAQFDAVNLDLSIPNVLVFVNHEDQCDKIDLYSTLTGNFPAANGERPPLCRHVSEGRIKDEKQRIHLYIWLEDRNAPHYQFSSLHQEKKLFLYGLFKLDQENIREIA